MLHEVTRPLSPAERADLEKRIRAFPQPKSFRARMALGCLGYTVGIVVFFLPLYFLGWLSGGEWLLVVFTFIVFLGLLICLAIPVASSWEALREKSPAELDAEMQIQSMQACLQEGMVTELRVEAVGVVTILTKDGPAYLFDVGDERCLFVRQGHVVVGEDGCPAASFTVLRSSDGTYVIGVSERGGKLTPTRHIAMSELGAGVEFPEDFAVLPGNHQEVLAALLNDPNLHGV